MVWTSWLVVWGMAGFVRGADTAAVEDAVHERMARWERAALNREWAAATKWSQADLLVKQAGKLRAASYSTPEEHRKNYQKAASAELRAAGLYASASAGFDKALSNWKNLDRLCHPVRDAEKKKLVQQAIRSADTKAREACRLAAEAYEVAADLFSQDKGGKLEASAKASEAAAACWEKLAARK